MNKKIIHIISRMNIGGPSKIINYYHEHLQEYEFDSILICGRPSEVEGEIKKPAIPITEMQTNNNTNKFFLLSQLTNDCILPPTLLSKTT